ncbi:MAG TPA: hypothetical protein ENN78_00580, partial [Candidatus Omnitrophica bacterium]|nr:hypothetical protein [Candidatus Omnitrophota bacterium]
EFNRQKEEKPRRLQEYRDNLESKKREIALTEEDLKRTQLAVKEKELELKLAEDGIKKYQQQLLLVKTNKEYKAMLTEIEGKKADNSCIEDEIIKIMDKLDEAELELNRKRKEYSELEKDFQIEEAKIKQEIAEIEKKCSQEKEKRDTLAQSVDPEILSVYERLLESKGGTAIVPVVEGACGGCHLSLRAQTINEIKRVNALISCERCSRIFYLDE